MTYFVIPSRRLRQPSGPVRVWSASPFANGLRGAVLPHLGLDVLNGPQIGGTRAIGAWRYGAARSFTTADVNSYGHKSAYAIVGDLTIVAAYVTYAGSSYGGMIAAKQATTTTRAPFEFRGGTGGNDQTPFLMRANAGGNRQWKSSSAWSNLIDVGGIVGVSAVTEISTAPTFYFNGEAKTATAVGGAGTGAATDDGASSLLMGRRYEASVTFNGLLSMVLLYSRIMSAEEHREIALYPWSWAAPDTNRSYFDAGAGGGAVSGTLTGTDGADSAAFSGSHTAPGVTGTLAATDGADSAVFSGTHTENATGTMAATDGADSAAFSGTERFTGTLAATEGADSAAFSGSSVNGVAGTLAATDGADSAAFSGTHTATATGTLSATDGADAAAFVGIFLQNITGTLAATDGADRASFAGTGGGIWTDISRGSASWSNVGPASSTWTNL